MKLLKYKEFVNESLNEKANYTMAKIDKWLKKNATKATGGGVWGPGYDYELKDGNPGTKVAIMDLGMKVNIGDKIERTISFANFQREYMNENLNEAQLGRYVDLGDVLIASKNFKVPGSPWHNGKVKKGQRFKILNAASYGWKLEDLQPNKADAEMMGDDAITIEVPTKKLDAWLEPEEPSAPYQAEFEK